MKKIIVLISILFILSGCTNHEELSDLAVVSGMAIVRNDDKFRVNVQVIKQNKNNNSFDSLQFVIYEGDGNSVSKAIDDIRRKIPKKMYMSQLQLLILDEDICKGYLEEVLNYFSINNDMRNEFFVLMSRDKKNSLAILNNSSSEDLLKIFKNNSSSMYPTLNDILSIYLNDRKEITIPNYKLDDDMVKIDGFGIFNNNKLIGYLNEDDSNIFNLITNRDKSIVISVDYNNSKSIVFNLVNTHTKMSLKDNRLLFNISGDAVVVENNNIDNNVDIERMEDMLNNTIDVLVKDLIVNNMYNSDIFGIRDFYYRNNTVFRTKYLNNIRVNSKISIIDDSLELGDFNNE